MIKRTEITIETVEITTLRRTSAKASAEIVPRDEMTGSIVMTSTAALEQIKEYESEEKSRNEKSK